MARTKNKKNHTASPMLASLMQEMAAETGHKETLVNPKGELSLSDAISKIIAPYRQDAPDYDAFDKLVAVACVAWNSTILPDDKRDGMLADMRANMPDKQSREDFMAIVTELMKRKKKLYPNVNRMIVKFKVTDLGNDFHIAIASTLAKKP